HSILAAVPPAPASSSLADHPPVHASPPRRSPDLSLVNGVATSPGYTATATGTDYWVASYSGDGSNAPVSSGTADEPVTIDRITRSEERRVGNEGDSMTDTATVTDASPTRTGKMHL